MAVSNEWPPPHKLTNAQSHTHTPACMNLTAGRHSDLTSSGRSSNPQANYKPHYDLWVLFPHHIHSAVCSDGLRTDVSGGEQRRVGSMYVYATHILTVRKLSQALTTFLLFRDLITGLLPKKWLVRYLNKSEDKHRRTPDISWRKCYFLGICLASVEGTTIGLCDEKQFDMET